VSLVFAAIWAKLLELEPVRVVAAVLFGDVVAVLAHLARQGDLGPYVGTGGHVVLFSGFVRCCLVAMAGLEPAT
jgi:hypothetical protein